MKKEKSAGAVIFREGNKERYYLVLHYKRLKKRHLWKI